MTRLGIAKSALRTGLAAGLAAAAFAWIAFVGLGGSLGMARHGALVPMAVFVVEVLLYAYAGFRLRRSGSDQRTAVVGGLVAGWTNALLSGFPRSAILLLSHAYMKYLLYTSLGYTAGRLHMPWPPLTLLVALVGALLAGTALGAACGSIGGSFARGDGVTAPHQLP